MVNRGMLGNLGDMDVFEVPKQLTHKTVEIRIPPTPLENQSSNVLFRLFSHAPSCKVETKEETVAYLVNTGALWGLNKQAVFADRSVINLICQCAS